MINGSHKRLHPTALQCLKNMATSTCLVRHFALIALLASFRSVCEGGKILVVPLDGSHWVNMNILVQALHKHGHTVDVVRSSKSWYIKEESPYYSSITVPVTEGFDERFMKETLKLVFDIQLGKESAFNAISVQLKAFSILKKVNTFVSNMTTIIFDNEDMIKMLKEKRYDLVLTDPAWGAGVLLARYLKLPLVYNVRWTTSGEGHFAIAPSPISYIPLTGSGLSDRMSFMQRVKNLYFYLAIEARHRFIVKPVYQAICDKYFNPSVDFFELLQGADIWLMRVDFVFEFPRPTMPNIVYIGGFHCQQSKPLPQDLEVFVQSSGEHGVIIMSLGTLVTELPVEIANEIAAAFAKLPQKVIWRHQGKRPSTLGNNTLLVDWMPQNDLLGHPKTRVFVGHGGTNGLQEALYHGIPVVGLPVFYDQFDNVLRLRDKGVAKLLSLAALDRNIFLESLKEVLQNPAFRENMKKLSRLHRDTPMKPMDSAIFWIEYVIRHRGAAHLRTESYKMPWYTYHSADVIVFLLSAVFLVFGLTLATIRCLWKKFVLTVTS